MAKTQTKDTIVKSGFVRRMLCSPGAMASASTSFGRYF